MNGFDRLKEKALEYIGDELEAMREDAKGDTEIEKLFFAALCSYVRLGASEYDHVLVPRDEEHLNSLLEMDMSRRAFIVQPQVQLPGWRVDFLIHSFDFGYPDRPQKWVKCIVECDGHDFHERTKDQAARDRSRDRAWQAEGVPVFRFTGRELWRDAWGCASQVAEWATRGI